MQNYMEVVCLILGLSPMYKPKCQSVAKNRTRQKKKQGDKNKRNYYNMKN